MPQRPIVRIVLLLAVAGLSSGIAGAVFTGGETAARDPVAPPAEAAPTTESAVAESPAPQPAPVEPPAPQPPDSQSPPNETVTATPTTADQTTADPPPAEAADQLVQRLRPLVAAPDPNVPDYDRDHFAGWLDTDGDCVNTRHEILQVEARRFSMAPSGCSVASGEWFDPYTGRTYTNPRDLDVDHVVALADAWVSGAYAWADELLDRFSNDLGNLNAIAASENRSKSAKGPADYTPSAPGTRCDYLVQYSTVKIRWQLSITPEDFAATERGLAGCDTGAIPVTPLRTQSPPPPSAAAAPSTTTAAPGCHPDYEPCLPNLPGDALNCGDLTRGQKPVTVKVPGTDPFHLDRDGDGRGCTS